MKQTNKVETLITYLSYSATGSLLFFAVGLKGIDNYENWAMLPISAIILGILSAFIVVGLLAKKFQNSWNYKNSKGVSAFFTFAVIFTCSFFGIGSVVNKSFMRSQECGGYLIESLQKNAARSSKQYVFIKKENGTERLLFGKAFNEKHNAGDSVNLCLVKGILGVKYYKINTIK